MATKADETTTTGNNCCVSCFRVLHEILFLRRHEPKNAALREVKVELTYSSITLAWFRLHLGYPLSYGVPVRERYGSTLLPATREQHDQNCTQSH